MNVSRRQFLGAAGLALTFFVPLGPKLAIAADAKSAKGQPPKALPPPPPNAFLHIGTDNVVTVMLAHSEMGQGIWTTLPMLLAEELDCDWSKIRAEHAPAADVYKFPGFGIQMTGGSMTTRGEFDRYRTIGATAKAMLLAAAATQFKTTPDKLHVDKGVITFGGKSITYGSISDAAMKLTPPAHVKLKEKKDWKILGRPTKRLDSPEKTAGRAIFGIDIQFPGLRTAVVARPPAFGATLVSVDDSAARKIPGVENVVRTKDGVAVVAKNFWSAKLGRDALVLNWKAPENGVTSAAQMTEFRAKAKTLGNVEEKTKKGDVEKALADAKKKFEFEYDFPYLAHAPMEPLTCTVKIDGDHCEMWTGTQFQTMTQARAAEVLGTKPENVTVHTTFLGGGFGRRANFASDWTTEAVVVAKAAGVPVKVVWTREDDIRGGYYRPSFAHHISVAVDDAGKPTAWDHVVVGQSIMAGTPFLPKTGIDPGSVEGLGESPYLENLPAKRISLHSPTTDIPVLWWRSVGNTHTAFVLECTIDDLAKAAGKDPLAYRLSLMDPKSRHAIALSLAAEKAGWGKSLPAGHALGLAVHESFGSIIAQVAEVSVDDQKNAVGDLKRGKIRVHTLTCAVDCGTVVNPLGVEAQIQSCVAYGLTAALYGKITLENGRVQQSNFHDYKPLRIHEMPKVAVHTIDSGGNVKMGGIGEPATAPIAPAVGNAIFALTGQRLRSLPFRLA